MPGPLAQLQAQLASIALHAPGRVGVEVKDLSTGLTSSINAGADMPAASVIKVPVMVEVFRQMSLGALGLNDVLRLRSSDRDWGWGELASARAGSSHTIRQLLWLMITNSDNTAANMLIRRVGRANVNATMKRLGLRRTVLADYIRSSGDIRALRSTPADMVRLLAEIAQEKVVDAWSCREMIAILEGQQINTLLPAPLPRGVPIAHKTGSLHDTLNDVGIVYANSGPYVIAVMTTNLHNLDLGRRFIHRVSRMAYGAFTRLAQLRAGGSEPAIAAGSLTGGDPALAPMAPGAPTWNVAPSGEDGVQPAPPPAVTPARDGDGTLSPPASGDGTGASNGLPPGNDVPRL